MRVRSLPTVIASNPPSPHSAPFTLLTLFALLTLLPLSFSAAQDAEPGSRICLAPTSAEMSTGNTADGIKAVRETMTSFLTGPTLRVTPLTSRLESQVREEARLAGCPYLLLTTMKHVHKTGGGGFLGRVAGGAVQQGAWSAAGGAGSTAGRVAASAAAAAAGTAASDWATSVKTKDQLTLTYRLEAADGKTLAEKTEKRKAKSDGEDLLTPLVEHASEAIAAAVAKPRR